MAQDNERAAKKKMKAVDRKIREMTDDEKVKERTFYEELGARMLVGRTKIRKSQREMGAIMFVTDNTVSSFESGTAKPRAYSLKRFCEATGTEPNVLFGYRGSESTSTELRIMAKLREMTEADKKKLLNVLNVLYPEK